MLGSELAMVRLARYWTRLTLNRPRLSVTSMTAVMVTATQNAGYRRTIRDTTNSRGRRFHALSSTTKPLIRKNRSTPR